MVIAYITRRKFDRCKLPAPVNYLRWWQAARLLSVPWNPASPPLADARASNPMRWRS